MYLFVSKLLSGLAIEVFLIKFTWSAIPALFGVNISPSLAVEGFNFKETKYKATKNIQRAIKTKYCFKYFLLFTTKYEYTAMTMMIGRKISFVAM